jgi:hypothetical protein
MLHISLGRDSKLSSNEPRQATGTSVRLRLDPDDAVAVELEAVIVAGFTGRDAAATSAHLDELAEIGVPVPATVPSFYPVPSHLLVADGEVTVTHAETSGEIEIVLVVDRHRIYVTVGSDHTDRRAETKDLALSKLACPKVIADQGWMLDEVRDHWDRLELRSWADGRLYQEGTTAALLAPEELLGQVPFNERPDTFVLFAGTLPAIGGIRASRRFAGELHDPVRRRSIGFSYDIRLLDVLGRSET